MIELLLPLNTIRYKYGMPERAGCGDVRHDLLQELERQQREKQPSRCRSMEQLGLPPPQLHKSRSMELARDAARGDDAWRLTPEPPSAARSMGRSAEDLIQIAEDEGAVGVFTAAPEGAAGGAEDEVAKGASEDGENDSAAGSEYENECTPGKTPVHWEVGSDDANDEIRRDEMQENASTTFPAIWPEVKIVVEEDVSIQGDITDHDHVEEDSEEQRILNEERKNQEENADIKTVKLPEQSSLSPGAVPDAAPLALESGSDFDFWGSTEQDFWSSADDSDKLGIDSDVQTLLSKSSERPPSPIPVEADAASGQMAANSVAPRTEDDPQENVAKCEDQQAAELRDTSILDQQRGDDVLSFWDVYGDDGKLSEDVEHCQSHTNSNEKNPSVTDEEQDSGFSFWNVAEDDEITEKTTSKTSETVSVAGGKTNDYSVASDTNHPDGQATAGAAVNVKNNLEPDQRGAAPSDVVGGTIDDVATENGEPFSFWDVSDEGDAEKNMTFPRSKTHFWDDDDTTESPFPPETKANKLDEPSADDSTCPERVCCGSGDDESPSPPDSAPRPLAVPHITVFDDTELMPAR